MKYYYSWSTAEGNHPSMAYDSNNKREAAQSARQMALGNCLHGSTAAWSVWIADGDNLMPILSGTVRA